MKVSQQGVYDAKAIAGIDKRLRFASSGFNPVPAALFVRKLGGVFRSVFQCADGGCAHSHHAPSLSLCPVDCLCRDR